MPKKARASVASTTKAPKKHTSDPHRSAILAAKSTVTAAQRDRIVALLRMRPHNGYELRRAGCFQAPTRIHELRARGYQIDTHRVVIVDRDGWPHKGVAQYSLISEPVGLGAGTHPTAQARESGGAP